MILIPQKQPAELGLDLRLHEGAVCLGGRELAQVLWRLEQYLKQGMSKDDALAHLRDSVWSDSGPTNPGKLAILSKDD